MTNDNKKKKGSRREYGDGSIYQRKDGRFTGSFRLPTGKRKYVYADTRPDAKKRLEEAKQQAQAGTLVASNRQKVAEFLAYWQSVHKLGVRATTNDLLDTMIHARILPAFGMMPLQKLSMHHVQRFITTLADEGLKASYIHLIYKILKMACNDAVKWKMLSSNPCHDVELPRIARDQMQVLDEVQAQTLLTSLRGQRLEAIITVALGTGLRRGELLGLKWSDLDFEKRVLHVERTLVSIRGQGYRETEPKTRASKRTITLAAFVLDALVEHRKRQLALRLQRGFYWQNNDLVFPNTKGGYLNAIALHRTFKNMLRVAGLPAMKFHGLRHTAATLLLKMGAQPKVVQEIMGHSSITMTMDLYGHLFPGMQNAAMDAFDTMMMQSRKEAR